MKKLILLSVLTVFLSASYIHAEGVDKKTKVNDSKTEISDPDEMVIINADDSAFTNAIPDDTKNTIHKKLTYPEFAKETEKEGIVMVSFTYGDDGYIKILSSNASDEKLNAYIIEKLEDIRLRNGNVIIGKEYNAKFHFKLL